MLRHLEYISGGTKAVDIDFSFMYPAISYFVNVNILFEFSTYDQVIPTRFDVRSYKLSSFAGHNIDNSLKAIDTMKFMLVLYTLYKVVSKVTSYPKQSQMLSFR